jgi:hypothetical protein
MLVHVGAPPPAGCPKRPASLPASMTSLGGLSIPPLARPGEVLIAISLCAMALATFPASEATTALLSSQPGGQLSSLSSRVPPSVNLSFLLMGTPTREPPTLYFFRSAAASILASENISYPGSTRWTGSCQISFSFLTLPQGLKVTHRQNPCLNAEFLMLRHTAYTPSSSFFLYSSSWRLCM